MPIQMEWADEEYGLSELDKMRKDELTYHVKPFHIFNQPEIRSKMRIKFAFSLLRFCHKHDMLAETAHLAVSLIDRVASCVIIPKSKLHLITLTALLIAADEEESVELVLTDENMIEITDESFTEADVLETKQQMTKYLKFRLHVPTAVTFINAYDEAVDLPPAVTAMSKYLVDLALPKGKGFLRLFPSMIAAAAIAVARMHLDLSLWSEQLEQTTGYKIRQLRSLIIALSKVHVEAFGYKNLWINHKYSSQEFMHVSTVEPYIITGFSLDQITRDASRFQSKDD